MRKPKRTCTTPKCKGKPTLYPQCIDCRKTGCLHTETHYDSSFAKVCDNCGTTVQEALKKKARRSVGKGQSRKAPWQGTPNGLKVPVPSCGVMS